ncbi:golgin subfamily A member 6-like protein 6 [Biomphalaria glabrata]|nr:golgin subfamily A member 6-like protein 6 [Biomphalaria glabrata]
MADVRVSNVNKSVKEYDIFPYSKGDLNTYHRSEQDLQDRMLALYGKSDSEVDLFRPALSDQAKIGFFSLDRACQTEVTEILDLKDMTKVLQTLLLDSASLRRDINLTKHVMEAEHESKIQEKSLELYCRINERVVELEKNHQDRVNSLRKAFRQQLADAIARLSVHYSKNLQSKMVRERTKQKSDLADKEEKFREMQATILRNEGIIQLLKEQLHQQNMKDDEEEERFMNRSLHNDDTPQAELLQEQLNNLQEELDSINKKLESSEKKNSRLEEALDIKEEQLTSLNKEIDGLKDQLERSNILIEQMKHEINEMMNEAIKEKEASKKNLNHQKEEMKRLMEEQIRLAKEEAIEKIKKEAQVTSSEDQARIKHMLNQITNLEAQLTKEKEKNDILTTKSLNSKISKDTEEKLKAEIQRLQSELEKTHLMWEKKFSILQQSMHALKDESYIRQTLQRQAAQLHQAAVSYSVDVPVVNMPTKEFSPTNRKPLPNINKHNKKGDSDQDKDCISYTISAPSGRGTAMFSVDENQIMSDTDLEFMPLDVFKLPEPMLIRQELNDNSRPSTASHVLSIPSVEAN